MYNIPRKVTAFFWYLQIFDEIYHFLKYGGEDRLMAVNGGEWRWITVNEGEWGWMEGDIKRAEKFSTLLFIYSHFVAIYHLQGFRPIYSAAILQAMSLRII